MAKFFFFSLPEKFNNSPIVVDVDMRLAAMDNMSVRGIGGQMGLQKGKLYSLK